jgi:subtilisin-like proprotein convertase family protein
LFGKRLLYPLVCGIFFYCLSFSSYAQPGNDDPCNAEVLDVDVACALEAFELTGATATTGVPAPGCAFYSGGDVWFEVVVPAEGGIIAETFPLDIFDTGMAIYSGSCGALNLVGCNDDGGTNAGMSYLSVNGFTPGESLWIRVWAYGNGSAIGEFEICVIPGIPIGACSTCATATSIAGIPFNGSYTTCGACDDVVSGSSCFSNYLGGEDYIFEYTPAATEVVTIDVVGTDGWTGVFLTEGCPTAGGICIAEGSSAAGDALISGVTLTGGITYYITVDTWPFPDCTPFTIDIFETVPPPNDDPCSAIPLVVGSNCLIEYFTNAGATDSGVADPGCANYAGGDVWFTATVPAGGEILIDMADVVMFDSGLAVYEGTCSSLTLVQCDDNGSANGLMSSMTLTGLTPGATVWIRVWGNSNTSNGEFGICLSEPIDCGNATSNATCGTAEPFCTGTTYSYCNTTAVPSLGGGGIYGCLGSSPNPAFFYLNVETNGPIDFSITQTSYGGLGLDVDFVLWGPFANQGDMCTSLAAGNIIDCSYSTAAVEFANIPNAIAGQWYMILITNFSNQAGVITFNQTNESTPGAGTTNCNLLTVDSPTCSGPTYTLTGSVLSPSPPSTGTLTISNNCGGADIVFNAPFANSIDFSFPNLCSNGLQCEVTGVFSAGIPTLDPVVYTAPNCNTFTAIPSVCSGGLYTLNGQVNAGCTPVTGTLTIATSCGGSVVYNAPFVFPINYSIPNLCGTGGACTATATFSATGESLAPVNFTAPSCNTMTAVPGTCTLGQYSVTGVITAGCLPTTGTLTVSTSCGGSVVYNAPFTSPINYTILNVPSTSGSCTVSAVFSAVGAPVIPTASYVAPICCSPLTVTATPVNPNVCSGGSGVVLTGTVPANSGPITFTNTTDYGILDASAGGPATAPNIAGGTWAQSPITVSGICPAAFVSGAYFQVCLNITHTWTSDLNIWLRSPTGFFLLLSDDNGGAGDNYTNTCFSSTAVTNIGPSAAPFTGSFVPEGAINSLAGQQVNGVWTLYVGDDAGGDVGTLLDWSISFAGPTVTYAWSPATGLSSTTVLNPTANPTSTQTYTLTADNSCGCTGSATTTVTVVNPVSAGTSGTASSCSTGSTFNLFSSLGGTPATTGTWSGPSATTGGYLGTLNPATAASGTYTYTVLGTSPCPDATATVNVTIVPAANATISYSAANYCSNGADVNPTITGTTGGTFSAAPAGLSITPGTGAIQPSLSSAGTYTITYTIAATGGCPAFTTTTTVKILEPMQIYVSGTDPSCPGICDGTATAVVTGGLPPYTYSWTGSASSSAVITGLCDGSYTATATDAIGCVTSCTPVIPSSCFQIQSVLVDACGSPEYSEEMVFFQVGPTPLNTSTLSVTWPTVADSWLGLCTNSAFIANVNATITGGGMLIPAPLNLPAGANVVLITANSNNNTSNLFTNLTGPLYVLFQCSGNVNGHFGNYNAAANLRTLVMSFGACTDQVSYYTNQLSPSDGATVLYTPGGVATYVNNGCVVPNSIQNCDITISAPPFDVLLSPTSASTCEGDPVVLSASGATTYTWTPTTNLSATTGSTVTASPTTTTTYSVTGFTGTCFETEDVTITVTPASDATVVYNGSPFCTDITSLQSPVITGTSGGTFSASPSGLNINAVSGAINPSASIPGTYVVTYIVAAIGTCPSFTTTATVSVTLAPAVPTLTPSNPCSEESTTFTAGNGTTFEFFINGISQGAPSSVSTFASGVLSAGDQVCVRSTPAIPFVMNGNINEPEWGVPLATSASGPAASGFGTDNNIDALFMKNMGGKLYCAVAGDEHDGFDQANNNWILLFIDSKPGGFNNLASWINRSNVPPSTNGLLNLALSQNVIFDSGFSPDYILTMNQANAEAYFDLYDMTANVNTYLGSNISNPSQFGFIGNAGTGDYTKGFEFNIPLSIIGSPTTSFSCFAMMVNDPNAGIQTFLSNQFLSSASAAQGNFGSGAVDFNNEPPSPINFILSADCFEETCVTIIPTVTPTFDPVPPLCYGETAPVLPTTSLNGVVGTWSPSVSNTMTNTYTFTPTSTQCTNTQTLTITVLPETLTTPIYHD